MGDSTRQVNTSLDIDKLNGVAKNDSPQSLYESTPLHTIGQHITPRYVVQMQRVVGNRAMLQMTGHSIIQRDHDSAETDISDHGADSLDLNLDTRNVDWSELTGQAINRRSEDTLFAVFRNLAMYHYEKAGRGQLLSNSQLREKFQIWLYAPVSSNTRSGFKKLIGLGNLVNMTDNVKNIVQTARSGNTYSVNGEYTGTSNAFDYENVIYLRDGDGNIDFDDNPKAYVKKYNTTEDPEIASKDIKWTHPLDDSSEVQMSNDLTDSESGLMPSGKKVKLKSATRSQHFAIADDLYDNDRAGTWTWHHLSDRYKMVLVDMRVHAKHGHNGGVHLWT